MGPDVVKLEQFMPVLIRHAGLDVALAPDLPDGQRDEILALLPDPALRISSGGSEVLKAARQRLVLRLPAPGIAGGSCIAKLFPLRNPISRLKHRKYARREFLNMIAARERGMPTPEALAFFQRRRFGLIAGSGLLIEDLRVHRDISALSTAQASYPAAANSALPALKRLYELGINHVDARDENILIAPGSRDGTDFRMIDWQYASLWPPRADWLLEHLAAYFIRMSPETARETLLAQWMPELHRNSAHRLPLDAFAARVARLLDIRPSTRARMRLEPAS